MAKPFVRYVEAWRDRPHQNLRSRACPAADFGKLLLSWERCYWHESKRQPDSGTGRGHTRMACDATSIICHRPILFAKKLTSLVKASYLKALRPMPPTVIPTPKSNPTLAQILLATYSYAKPGLEECLRIRSFGALAYKGELSQFRELFSFTLKKKGWLRTLTNCVQSF